MYAGAELASRFASDNERLQLTAMAILYSAYGLITPFIYLSPNKYVALGLIALTSFAASLPWGPLFALIQTLVPERMRAMAIAVIFLSANLIGLGLGPLAAGALSDALRPIFGEESLRYTLLVFCPGYVWGGWHLWRASRTVFHDIEAVHVDCGGGDAKIFA